MKKYLLDVILSLLVTGCSSNPTAMEPKPSSDFRRPHRKHSMLSLLGTRNRSACWPMPITRTGSALSVILVQPVRTCWPHSLA
jgi:hypothetical protein